MRFADLGLAGAGFLGAGFVEVAFLGGALFLENVLGGGAEGFPSRGGIARIKHLGPEPMRSSRWALSSASLTR